MERCWILVGAPDADGMTWTVAMAREDQGAAARCEADWAWTLHREEERGDVAGFFHTHPPGGGVRPSERDLRTMQAWTLALGKPLLCLIAPDDRVEEPSGYLFAAAAEQAKCVASIERLEAGIWRVRL
jgi:hypothetical protein